MPGFWQRLTLKPLPNGLSLIISVFCLFVCLSFGLLSVCLSVGLFGYLYVCSYVCLFIRLLICLFSSVLRIWGRSQTEKTDATLGPSLEQIYQLSFDGPTYTGVANNKNIARGTTDPGY